MLDGYGRSWTQNKRRSTNTGRGQRKQDEVGANIGHPPLTAKLVPSGTLENWLQAGELRGRWDNFLAASNTMLRHMLRVRRLGMLALNVNDAEPSSGEEEELAMTDAGESDGPAP